MAGCRGGGGLDGTQGRGALVSASAQTKGSHQGQMQITVTKTNEVRGSPLPEVTLSGGHHRVRRRPPLHGFLQNLVSGVELGEKGRPPSLTHRSPQMPSSPRHLTIQPGAGEKSQSLAEPANGFLFTSRPKKETSG